MSPPPDHEPQSGSAPPANLAAEFALGVLDTDAHQAAQVRAERDPAFAAEAEAWAERLSPLLDAVEEARPSPAVWARIENLLDVPNGHPETVTRLPERGAELVRLGRRLQLWRAAALAAAAACLVLAIGLGLSLARTVWTPPAMMVARLDGAAAAPAMTLAAYDPLRRVVLVSTARGAAPQGKAAELWLIDATGKPHSLGLLRSGDVVTLMIPAELAPNMRRAATLAISVEPPGGSPTGLPTGPVVAKGGLTPA